MSYYFLQPPTPLQTDKQPAEFPIHALPENIGEYVTQVAKAVQVHHDMTAVPSLAVLASCAQGKARIQLTPEWTEELNLYIAVVAEPGQRKSKIFSTLTKPVTDYVNTYNAENAADIYAYRNKLARLISHKNSLINSNASDEDIANVQAEISELMAHPKSEMRLIASDCTSEALASVMSSNNDKIAILTDEGVFEVMAGLYNNGKANINIYLNSYDGQAISIDRKSSGSLILKRPLISFGVCCQPSVIGDFISDKSFIGKGLVQRFMFCQPPSLTGTRKLCTTPIDEKRSSDSELSHENMTLHKELDRSHDQNKRLYAKITDLKQQISDTEAKHLLEIQHREEINKEHLKTELERNEEEITEKFKPIIAEKDSEIRKSAGIIENLKTALDKAYSFVRDICLAVATLFCGRDDKAKYNADLSGKPLKLAEAILNLGSKVTADAGFDNYSDDIDTKYGIYKSIQEELDEIDPPVKYRPYISEMER